MWPSLPGGNQGEWHVYQGEQIPRAREKCPICGNFLTELFGGIGGFPGHEHVHPGALVGYNCYECMRKFTPDEILLAKEKKTRRNMLTENYWKDVRACFRSYYLYVITACFMLLLNGFWAGIAAGVIILFLMPILAKVFEIIFMPLGRLVRKILPSDKPPDNPRTP